MSVGAANFSSFQPEFLPEVNIEPYKVVPKLLRVVTSTNSTLMSTQSTPALPPGMLKCSSLLAILLFRLRDCVYTGLTSHCVGPVMSAVSLHCTAGLLECTDCTVVGVLGVVGVLTSHYQSVLTHYKFASGLPSYNIAQ